MQYDYLVHAAGGVTSYFGMESIPFEVRAFNRLAPDTSKSWVRAAKALLGKCRPIKWPSSIRRTSTGLHVHLHVLALDGAYTFEHGKTRFHRAPAPQPGELEALLWTLITRITCTLARAGVLVAQAEQPYLDLAMDSPYEQLTGAAIRSCLAAGPQAAHEGFSLNCAVVCEAHERPKLERVCRPGK